MNLRTALKIVRYEFDSSRSFGKRINYHPPQYWKAMAICRRKPYDER
jgi:hypothetical protein